jgi:hypothetical protein
VRWNPRTSGGKTGARTFTNLNEANEELALLNGGRKPAYLAFETDPNHQALKDFYRRGLDAHGRTAEQAKLAAEQAKLAAEQARRDLFTNRFIDQLENETGYGLHFTGLKLIAAYGNESEFIKLAVFMSEEKAKKLYMRVGEMLRDREKFARGSQAHHLIPWDNEAYNHHVHPLLKLAKLDSREALRDYGNNLVDVIGHGNLPGEKGGHWAPYHDAVRDYLTAGIEKLRTNGTLTEQAARDQINAILKQMVADIDSGKLRLYRSGHDVSIYRP